MIDIQLDPCPFCGGRPKFGEPDGAVYTTKILCTRCKASIEAKYRPEAIKRWNRRATEMFAENTLSLTEKDYEEPERVCTNQQVLISVLKDELDDGGSSREAWVYYNIDCPYSAGDERCFCVESEDAKTRTRETCVACKEKWLESEVDE